MRGRHKFEIQHRRFCDRVEEAIPDNPEIIICSFFYFLCESISMKIKLHITGLQTQLITTQEILKFIPVDILTEQTPVKGFGTIGQQFRHIVNYVEVLLRDYPNGHIDFPNRNRDERLETDKIFIAQRLKELTTKIEFFLDKDPDENMTSAFVAITDQPSVLDRVSLGFLINYVSDHTYHHISMIKILARLQGITINFSGGVSPATQSYQNTRT